MSEELTAHVPEAPRVSWSPVDVHVAVASPFGTHALVSGAGDARLTWSEDDADPRRLAQLVAATGERMAATHVPIEIAYRPLEAVADVVDLLAERRIPRNADDEELRRVARAFGRVSFLVVASADDASPDTPASYGTRLREHAVTIVVPAAAGASCAKPEGMPRLAAFAEASFRQLHGSGCAENAFVVGLDWSDPGPNVLCLHGSPMQDARTGAPSCRVTVGADRCDAARGWRAIGGAPETCEVLPLVGPALEACRSGTGCASGWMLDTARGAPSLRFTGGGLAPDATTSVRCNLVP